MGCDFFPQQTEHKDTVATQKRVVTRKALTIEVACISTTFPGYCIRQACPAPKRTGFFPQREAGRNSLCLRYSCRSRVQANRGSEVLGTRAFCRYTHPARCQNARTPHNISFPTQCKTCKTLNIGDGRACDEQITLKLSGRDYCTSVSSSKIRAIRSLREADNSSATLQLLY